jgi:hypothetical protein
MPGFKKNLKMENWELTLDQFVLKTRTIISKRLQNVGHAYNRNITVFTHHVYVNTNTLKTFNPKTIEDCAICKSFSNEDRFLAIKKAHEYIIEAMKGY